jgi:topoisomerase IA-like protein
MEPTEVQSFLIPIAVCSKTSKPELCFVNVTDKNIILHSGQEIATVEEAQVLCAETESKTPNTRVSKKTDTMSKHTEELFR